MWKVTAPQILTAETFLLCAASITNRDERERVLGHNDYVLKRSSAFVEAVRSGSTHALAADDFTMGQTHKADMTGLYKDHFAKKESVGRPRYDALRTSSIWCPSCGHRTVNTLDHYLPKNKFPSLSVTSENLTPMCKSCNESKSQFVARERIHAPIHPYYDDFEDRPWLQAEVRQTPEPWIFFSVTDAQLSAVELSRARGHFERFKLGELYSVQAARFVAQYNPSFGRSFASGGSVELRRDLQERAQDFSAYKVNSWEGAMCRALARDDWFCLGGFASFVG